MTRSALGTAAGIAALALVAGGCSLGGGPDAGPAVDKLTAGLSKGDVKTVPWAGDKASAAKEYDAALGTLSGVPVKVTSDDPKTHDKSGSVKLHWAWTLGAKKWTYDTTADLTQSGDSWKVDWKPALLQPELTSGATLAKATVKSARGDILGAGGAKLVTPRPVYRIGVDKQKVTGAQVAASARAVAQAVDVDPAGFAKEVAAAGPKQFVEAIVLRRATTSNALLTKVGGITGGRVLADQLPLAPSKDFAAALLGTVGQATADAVKKSKGRVQAGDDVGLSGLESRYDEQLAGSKGVKISLVDGEKRSALFSTDPVAGKPLQTTLDPRLQQLGQDALGDVGPASALVAIKPSTGDILAAASGPGSKGYNTATYGQYAPGSTFKIVSALALLRAGMTPDATISCPATLDVNGKRFKNYSDYPASAIGTIKLADAFANSCNTAFINARDKVDGNGLVEAANALGMGVDHDVGFPAYFGQVKPPAGETERAADMIGQGKDLASPMTMATVVASVVAGHTVVPRLLPGATTPKASPAKPLTAAEASKLQSLMRGVVERGSGKLLAGLPGPPVLAKTGTAEYGDKPPLPTHAWMVAAHGDLAVAVFVDTGSSGSGTAGPILKRFLQQAG